MNEIVLKNTKGEIFTTSLMVAEKFGKRHSNVLRVIEKLPKDEFNGLNFEPVNYTDSKGEKRKMYEITRDGFTILAMGFTGDEAYKWKVKFIDAFNKMERHLKNMLSKDWLAHRSEASLEYKVMSRTLQEVRQLQGKSTRSCHFINEAKLVNWALTGEFKKVDRDQLSKNELGILTTLEAYNAVLLGAGHERDARKPLLKSRYQQLSQVLLAAA